MMRLSTAAATLLPLSSPSHPLPSHFNSRIRPSRNGVTKQSSRTDERGIAELVKRRASGLGALLPAPSRLTGTAGRRRRGGGLGPASGRRQASTRKSNQVVIRTDSKLRTDRTRHERKVLCTWYVVLPVRRFFFFFSPTRPSSGSTAAGDSPGRLRWRATIFVVW